MDDSLTVTVDGLVMHGRPGLGPYTIIKDGVTGIDDGVDPRGEASARPQANGSLALPRTLDSRVVSFAGVILADSGPQQDSLGERMTGLLSTGQLGRITIQRPSTSRWVDAMLGAKTKVVKRRGTYWSDFQLQLWCPDPQLYGDVKDFTVPSGAAYVSIFHRGNTLSLPTLVIAGNMPGGYRVQSAAGAEYRVNRALVSGAPHTIDMRDGLLQIGGAYVTDGIGVAGIWRISSGTDQTIRIQPVSTGTAVMTVYVTDTYI